MLSQGSRQRGPELGDGGRFAFVGSLETLTSEAASYIIGELEQFATLYEGGKVESAKMVLNLLFVDIARKCAASPERIRVMIAE